MGEVRRGRGSFLDVEDGRRDTLIAGEVHGCFASRMTPLAPYRFGEDPKVYRLDSTSYAAFTFFLLLQSRGQGGLKERDHLATRHPVAQNAIFCRVMLGDDEIFLAASSAGLLQPVSDTATRLLWVPIFLGQINDATPNDNVGLVRRNGESLGDE